jgi:hypothetical protein
MKYTYKGQEYDTTALVVVVIALVLFWAVSWPYTHEESCWYRGEWVCSTGR